MPIVGAEFFLATDLLSGWPDGGRMAPRLADGAPSSHPRSIRSEVAAGNPAAVVRGFSAGRELRMLIPVAGAGRRRVSARVRHDDRALWRRDRKFDPSGDGS